MRRFFQILVIIFATLNVSFATYAQDVTEFREMVNQWDDLFARSEAITEKQGEGIRTDTLELIQTELEDIRVISAERTPDLQKSLDSLEKQIAVLGEENTSVDTQETINRRNALQADYGEIQEQILTLKQSAERAQTQIDLIDEILFERTSEELLRRTGFPLSPSAILAMQSSANESIQAIYKEVKTIATSKIRSGEAIETWPGYIIITIIGFGILIASRKIIEQVLEFRLPYPALIEVQKWLLPSFQVGVIYALGLFLIFSGIYNLGIFGEATLPLFITIEIIAGFILLGLWVKEMCALIFEINFAPIILIALAIYGYYYSLNYNDYLIFDAQTIPTQIFLILAALLVLFFPFFRKKRLIEILANGESENIKNYVTWFNNFSRYGLIFSFLIIGLGFSILGYFLSRTIIISVLIVICAQIVFILLFNLVKIAIEAVTKKEIDASSSTTGLIILLIVSIIALLALAMEWGVISSDFGQLWVSWQSGIQIGDLSLSGSGLMQLIISAGAGYVMVRIAIRLLESVILPRTKLESSTQNSIVMLSSYLGYTIVAYMALIAMGVNMSTLTYIISALSVGIGFGLQNIVSNFISGIILLIERPIKKGDWISVSGYEGYVREIAVRSTEIETFDRATVLIPNSDLISSPMLNWVHSTSMARVKIPLGVSYHSDVRFVEKLLYEVCEQNGYALKYPKPSVLLMNFGESSIDFEMRFFIKTADDMPFAISEANFLIFDKFKEHNIEIPFPQREIRIVNSETPSNATIDSSD